MNHSVALLQPLINYSYPTTTTTTTLYYSLQRSSSRSYYKQNPRLLHPRFKSSSPIRSNSIDESTTTTTTTTTTTSTTADALKSDYKPGIFDHLFLTLFRNKMVEEVGWDSDKPGYQGLIEVVNRLMMKNQNNSETEKAAVRILRSLFPPLLLELYKMLLAPLGKGQVAAVMVAKVTQLSCQWLMGRCTMNSVDLPNGISWGSGVLVERCKYLEESKCVGICINTCKLPTQTFFKDYMGVPLVMEPNFTDYSCQFKFGVLPPIPLEDKTLTEPCLEICPNATRRKKAGNNANIVQCPKV